MTQRRRSVRAGKNYVVFLIWRHPRDQSKADGRDEEGEHDAYPDPDTEWAQEGGNAVQSVLLHLEKSN